MNTDLTLNDSISAHIKECMERALLAERYPLWQRACPELEDRDFVHLGVLRGISPVDSGRHFLQTIDEVHGEPLPLSTYFKSLKSPRRTSMLEAVEQQSYQLNCETLLSEGVDYLEQFSELDGYLVEAADGHFIEHACHTEKGKTGKVYAAGFIYALNLRNGLLRPICPITSGTVRHHEIPALRKQIETQNNADSPSKKCLTVYDKAATDYPWWNQQKSHGNYMITVLKDNSKATFVESIPFETADLINTGIEGYSRYEIKGITFSLVDYRDPETKKLYRFVSTLPETMNPGTIAILYYKRWTIEKAFNNSKSNLKETKAWSENTHSLNNQMRFTAMTYNLIRVFEEVSKIQRPEFIHPSDEKYNKALEKRQRAAKKRGCFVNPLFFQARIVRISSYTIRAVQNAIVTGRSMVNFLGALVARLIPRTRRIGEH